MTTKYECDRCGEMSVSHTNMLTYENSHGADGHLCPDCEEAFERFLDIHVDEVELA